jgi:hypothetical protein
MPYMGDTRRLELSICPPSPNFGGRKNIEKNDIYHRSIKRIKVFFHLQK